MELTIQQYAAYSINTPETISVQVPAASLVGGIEPLRAEPSFIIEAPQAGGLFGGTLLRNVGENELRATANFTLSVTLSGDEWDDDVGKPCLSEEVMACVTTAMLSNLVATSSSPFGWNAIGEQASDHAGLWIRH